MRRYFSIFIMIGSLVLGSLSLLFAQTQSRYARNISQQYGLPTQTIYDLHIDKMGYLYLGTDLGLYRFNGTSFQKIPTIGKIDAAIDNIETMTDNTLWCKNFANQLLILENDTLKEHPTIKEAIGEKGVLEKFVAHEQQLYIANHHAVHRFDKETNELIRLHEVSPGNTNDYTRAIIYDTRNNQPYFQRNEASLDEHLTYINPSVISAYALFEGKMIGTQRNLQSRIFDLDQLRTLKFPELPEGSIIYFPRSLEKELWICTNQGAFEIDLESSRVKSKILEGYRVSDILMDQEGNYWIGTLDEGLFFFPSLAVFNTELNNRGTGQTKSYISAVLTKNENIMVGTSDGHLIELSSEGKIIRTFYTGLNIEIEFLYYDSEKNLLLCSNGIFEYDNLENGESYYLGKAVQKDESGNYLLAYSTFTGLINNDFIQEPNVKFQDNFEMLALQGTDTPLLQISEARGKAVHYSKDQKLYILASVDDLRLIDEKGKLHKPRLEADLPLVINAIAETPDGQIWLASAQDGLIKLSETNNEFKLEISGHLTDAAIEKLIASESRLYALTAGNIYQYLPSKKQLDRLPVSDIFSGVKINDIQIFGQEMWIFSSEGVHYFLLDEEWKANPPVLVFKGARVNGIAKASLGKLSHTENNLSLEFDLIQLGSNGSSQLQFRLDPNQEEWESISGSPRFISLPALAPGSYSVEVKGLAKGLFSNVLHFPFKITQIWYRRLDVQLSLLFLSILLMGYTFKKRETRRKKEAFLKLELAKSQIRSLRSQMNPHFLFNILNAVQGFIYAGKKSDAAEYLSNFSTLMRKTLEFSDEQTISLAEEIEVLKLYIELEIPRFDEKIDFQFEVEQNIDTDAILIPSLLLQPFVENALKHGLMHKEGQKKLHIRINLLDDKILEIQIQDNGIGRKASEQINQRRKNHKSFATNAIFSRLDLINETLNEPILLEISDVEVDGKMDGTLVKIKLPITDD